jgi:hypothetical protein
VRKSFLNEDNHLIVRASMTPAHNSLIKIQIFPKQFYALDQKLKSQISSDEYFQFLEEIKEQDGPEKTTEMPKRTTQRSIKNSEMPRSRLG